MSDATFGERCGDCYYHQRGECHRNPPQAFPMPQLNPLTGKPDVVVLGIRPPTPDGGWCGDFKAKVTA